MRALAQGDGIRPEALEVLRRYFGYPEFRANQAEIIEAVLGGRDALAVMPTGAGKSVCYQVPAMVAGGWTLVVSPLISLMKDQVNALNHQGIPAAFVNSSLSGREQAEALDAAARGEFKLLYVAPERLDAPMFANFCAGSCPALVAVDEAHCVSQWGQDFRPSYTRISAFVASLPQRPPVLALTATATAAVRDDIRKLLDLRNPFTVVSSFDRPNLRFEVKSPKDKDRELLRVCKKAGADKGASGIVYCSSRRAVEEVCDTLCGEGLRATRYHAGLPDAERRTNQDDFLYDRKPVMVATNAFGMGIDKSNVSFVVHYNMPKDLESYYQEAGRAGRDGEPALCVLLYAPRDVRSAEFLMAKSLEEAVDVDAATRRVLRERAEERLRQMTFYSTTSDCLRRFILRYFGENAPISCGNCSNCSTVFEERDVTVEAQKVLSCILRLAQRGRSFGRGMVADILVGSKAAKVLDGGYDTLSTYGIMASDGKRHVMLIIDALLERGLVARGGEYSTLSVTEAGAAFLRERQTLAVKIPKPEPRRSARDRAREAAEKRAERAARQASASRGGSFGSSGSNPPSDGGDLAGTESLFAELKQLRYDIAAEEGVPAYIVFTNHALHDMCRKMPTTLDEFMEVSGVGEVKAERYGSAFLEAIAAWQGGFGSEADSAEAGS